MSLVSYGPHLDRATQIVGGLSVQQRNHRNCGVLKELGCEHQRHETLGRCEMVDEVLAESRRVAFKRTRVEPIRHMTACAVAVNESRDAFGFSGKLRVRVKPCVNGSADFVVGSQDVHGMEYRPVS